MKNPLQKDYTPTAVVHQGLLAISEILDLRDSRNILDLSAGSGSFGSVFSHVFPRSQTTGVELRESEAWWLSQNYDRYKISRFQDVKLGKFNVVASNPPFYHWEEALEIGYDLLKNQGVLILLGTTSWGSRSSAGVELFRKYPVFAQLRIPATVGFHGSSASDVKDYCWWVWAKDINEEFWITINLPRLDVKYRKWLIPPGRETGYGKSVILCPDEYKFKMRKDATN